MTDYVEYVALLLEGLGYTSVYRSTQPTKTDDCITVSVMDGSTPTVYFGQSDGFYYPYLQIQVRNKSDASATTFCNSIKSELQRYHDSVIEGMLLVGDVVTIGRDELGRMEKRMNFRLIVKE